MKIFWRNCCTAINLTLFYSFPDNNSPDNAGFTMEAMDLSIIIVNRNTCDLLQIALKSIQESHDNFNKEILVVDNGSEDRTVDMLEKDFPNITVFANSENLGFSKANNLAAKQARGKYLCLMNSDARLKKESLSLAIPYLREHEDCGVAGGQLLNADGSLQNSIANYPTLASELLNKSLLRRLFPYSYPGKCHRFQVPTKVESVIGAFLLTPRSVWEELGGLDERYFFFMEETDYCLRVSRTGRKVIYLPEVEVWHDQGQTAKKVHVPVRIEYWRSRYLYFHRHHSFFSRLALHYGLLLRLEIGLIFNCLPALFSRKCRERCFLNLRLLLWHCCGCPKQWGLTGIQNGAVSEN